MSRDNGSPLPPPEHVRDQGGPAVRAVFYGHCARMSGAEIALLNTVPNLHGCESTVILGEDGPLVRALRSAAVTTEVLLLPAAVTGFSRQRVGFSLGSLRSAYEVFRYSLELRGRLRGLRPDVIVSNTMKGHVIIALATLGSRVPVAYYVRDHISTDFMSAAGVKMMRLVLRLRARYVVANSSSTLQTVPVSRRQRVRVAIPSPIVRPTKGGIRHQALDPHPRQAPFVFGMVGRLTPWKGQDLALRGFARAQFDESVRLEFAGGALFGETDYLATLHALARDLGISDRVTFLGHVDDVYVPMARWSALVHTSVIPEPFGQVVVQGMAAGLPVIAAAEGGPAGVITDGQDGVLYEPRDPADLARAMRRVRDDPGLASRIGEAACSESQHYFVEPITARLREVLKTMALRRLPASAP